MLTSKWIYLILTHVNHFMYFHGNGKVTSNSQCTFYWLCVVNHQEIISASQFGWMLRLVSAGWLYHKWALLNDTCRTSVYSHHEVFSTISCILTVTLKKPVTLKIHHKYYVLEIIRKYVLTIESAECCAYFKSVLPYFDPRKPFHVFSGLL